MRRILRIRALRTAAGAAMLLGTGVALAQVVTAEPVTPVDVAFPPGESVREVQVTLQLVVDTTGHVESAVEASRLPRDASDAFAQTAMGAIRGARFAPSTREGRPIRSRIEYVVVFHADSASSVTPPLAGPSTLQPQRASAPMPPLQTVQVNGVGWASPRGLGDIRVDRETLTASPHQQTSEMLSAAPGFFVDHEDGEGLGNDVYLRGFNLDNGSGIEMKVGEVPINIPMHIHGQGYADANFIIPEVVRSIRVLEGPYDPRQGDSAVVGSALFDLGVPERGYQLRTTYGSFNQTRVVGIAAPRDASDETFAAFSLRQTQGFGQDRAARSGSVNAQYGVDLGENDHVRILGTAYAASAALPGVVRKDDVHAGRIGFYDAYRYFNSHSPEGCSSASCAQPAQGVVAARVIVGAELDHLASGGARFDVAPWAMWTNFRSRQNYTGALNSSNLQPSLASLGDLWQLANAETAGGFTARIHSAPLRVGSFLEIAMDPGVSVRAGHTEQSKDLLNPTDLQPWDYRANYGLDTADFAGYVDVDARLWRKLRISGGVRADFLDVTIQDRLARVVPPVPAGALPGQSTNVTGVAPGPRVTVAYEVSSGLMLALSAGEGFRSLDAGSLTVCNGPTLPSTSSTQLPPCTPGRPFSKVTSVEAGVRSEAGHGRYVTTLTAFQTNVANELVFEVTSGGLTTERASIRHGVVGSALARPFPWLLASSALSVQMATFDTLVAWTSHYVPGVPEVLWRLDLNAHGELVRVRDAPITARAGFGYTLVGGRHVNDRFLVPTNNVLDALTSVRYRFVELGLDVYNMLGLQYADDTQYYISNWAFQPGQQPASAAVHTVAAPPRTVLGTLTLYL